jgi:predicted nucleic acid-binding Zn ribbon protein
MTKKPRFRPTLKQYQSALLALGLSDRCSEMYKNALAVERKNHRETWRISMYYLSAMLILVWAPIIIHSIYGV